MRWQRVVVGFGRRSKLEKTFPDIRAGLKETGGSRQELEGTYQGRGTQAPESRSSRGSLREWTESPTSQKTRPGRLSGPVQETVGLGSYRRRSLRPQKPTPSRPTPTREKVIGSGIKEMFAE